MTDWTGSDASKAEEILGEYLCKLGPGESVDAQALYLTHPDLVDELRFLLAARESAIEMLKVTRDGSVTMSTLATYRGAGEEESRTDSLLERLKKRIGEESRYKVLGEFARGGMGVILKVWDNDLRRTLAMKVVLEEEEGSASGSKSKHILDRFLEEAQVTGQLDHPGIVPVHELGLAEDGRVFFTMKLVQGRELKEVIRLSREELDGWNKTRALGVLLKVCETVAYAHSKSVVHRDLKPSNVMIGRFGETYVMDWGLARVFKPFKGAKVPKVDSVSVIQVLTDRHDGGSDHASQSATETQRGAIVGTPYYMAPEQAGGLIDEIGPHSDVYAVGCMLYQLLAGIRPYETEPPSSVGEIVAGVLNGPPRPVQSVARAVPPELAAICDKAMAHDWRDRYANTLEMAEDLRAFLEGRVVAAYATGSVVRLKKWIARNRAISGAVLAVLLMAVVGAVSYVRFQKEKLRAIQHERDLTAEARDLAEDNEKIAIENAASERSQRYHANLIAADASLKANEILEAKRRLQDCPTELYGWEWRHLAMLTDMSQLVLEGHDDTVTAVDHALGESLVFSGAADGNVRIWDASSGTLVHSIDAHEASVIYVDVSPDGSELRSIGEWPDGTLRRWDVRTGRMISVLQLAEAPQGCAVLDEQGSRVALAASDNSVRVFDTENGLQLHMLEGHEQGIFGLAFSADGRFLVSASEDHTASLWDAETGDKLRDLKGHGGAVLSVAFHPSGKALVTGSEDGTVRRWTVRPSPSLVLSRPGAPVRAVAYSHDGRRVGAASEDKRVNIFDSADGNSIATLRGHGQAVHSIAFLADDSRLVTGSQDRSIRLWDADRAGHVDVVRGPDEFVTAVSITRDEARIASSWGGDVRIIDSSSLELVGEIIGDGDPINALAFNATDDLLAGGFEASAVRVWDASSLELRHDLIGHDASITAVAFDPLGGELASASTDYTVKLWDLSSGLEVRSLEGHTHAVNDLRYSPAGDRIATGASDGVVLIWDADSGEMLQRLDGHEDGVYALAWSPDARQLAVGSGDHHLRLWNVEEELLLETMRGHGHRVSTVLFSPDGYRIVSGSFDGTVRLWDADSFKPLLSLRGHDGPVLGVTMGGPGTRIASVSYDSTLRIWKGRQGGVIQDPAGF